jgi:hypothetical protein
MTPMSELLDYAQEAAMEFLEEDCDLSVWVKNYKTSLQTLCALLLRL